MRKLKNEENCPAYCWVHRVVNCAYFRIAIADLAWLNECKFGNQGHHVAYLGKDRKIYPVQKKKWSKNPACASLAQYSFNSE